MWDRKELKTRAKEALRGSYWKAFLVSLVIAFVGGNGPISINLNFGGKPQSGAPHSSLSLEMFFLFIAMGLLVVLFIAAFRIFLGYALEIGGRRYFIRSSFGESDMNALAYSFNKKRYSSIVKTMLWRAVLNFFWYLLLIVPGIVKSYAYSMVPYILAENPNIGRERAVDLSIEMTRGQKFRIFVLDLSFIGWCILGILALIVGILFVLPYINATKAELYIVLRRNVLERAMHTRRTHRWWSSKYGIVIEAG